MEKDYPHQWQYPVEIRFKSRCPFEYCKGAFTTGGAFLQHIEEKHNLPLVKEELLFSSFHKFLLWKEVEEDSTHSLFVKIKTWSRGTLYACHFHKTKCENFILRKREPIDSSCACFSRLLVKEISVNLVFVYYVKNHSHPRQPLDYSIVSELPQPLWSQRTIENLFRLGFKSEYIVNRILRFDIHRTQRWRNHPGLEQNCVIHYVRKLYFSIGKMLVPQNLLEELLVEWSQEKESPLILLKEKGVSMQVGPLLTVPLPSQTEAYGFQTATQRNVMQDYAESFLMINISDSTLELFGLYTITVAVSDEESKEYPVAHFFVSHLEATLVSYCLLTLQNRLGNTRVGALIVQDESFIALIYAVFGINVDVFLCQTAVWSVWEKTLAMFDDTLLERREMTVILKAILSETDQEQFVVLCQNFRYTYYDHPFCQLFDRYLSPDSMPRWSAAFRPEGFPLNNMGAELVETFFKKKYIDRMPQHGKFELLSAISQLETDYYVRSSPPTADPYVDEIHHVCANCLKPQGPGKWDVNWACTRTSKQLKRDERIKCQVRLSEKPCLRKDCKVFPDRPKFCIHLLTCSCTSLQLDCPHIISVYDLYEEEFQTEEDAPLSPTDIARRVFTDDSTFLVDVRERVLRNWNKIMKYAWTSKLEVWKMIDCSLRDIVKSIQLLEGEEPSTRPSMASTLSPREEKPCSRMELPQYSGNEKIRNNFNLRIKFKKDWRTHTSTLFQKQKSLTRSQIFKANFFSEPSTDPDLVAASLLRLGLSSTYKTDFYNDVTETSKIPAIKNGVANKELPAETIANPPKANPVVFPPKPSINNKILNEANGKTLQLCLKPRSKEPAVDVGKPPFGNVAPLLPLNKIPYTGFQKMSGGNVVVLPPVLKAPGLELGTIGGLKPVLRKPLRTVPSSDVGKKSIGNIVASPQPLKKVPSNKGKRPIMTLWPKTLDKGPGSDLENESIEEIVPPKPLSNEHESNIGRKPIEVVLEETVMDDDHFRSTCVPYTDIPASVIYEDEEDLLRTFVLDDIPINECTISQEAEEIYVVDSTCRENDYIEMEAPRGGLSQTVKKKAPRKRAAKLGIDMPYFSTMKARKTHLEHDYLDKNQKKIAQAVFASSVPVGVLAQRSQTDKATEIGSSSHKTGNLSLVGPGSVNPNKGGTAEMGQVIKAQINEECNKELTGSALSKESEPLVTLGDEASSTLSMPLL